jgi:hypothetical protein
MLPAKPGVVLLLLKGKQMDRNCTLICTNADKAVAEALAATFPGGAGTFGVKLTSQLGGTIPTHWAGSGYVDAGMAAAFEVSVAPMFQVVDNDGTDFNSIIASRTPRLYRIVEEL